MGGSAKKGRSDLRSTRLLADYCDGGAVSTYISGYLRSDGSAGKRHTNALAAVKRQWQGIKAKELAAVKRYAMQIIAKEVDRKRRLATATPKETDFVRLPTRRK